MSSSRPRDASQSFRLWRHPYPGFLLTSVQAQQMWYLEVQKEMGKAGLKATLTCADE